MSVLIHGLEMPQEGFVEILIREDGTVQQTGQSYRIDGTDYYTPYVGETPAIHKAVPVPPHGRLIDADWVRNDIDKKRPGRSYEDAWALTIIDAAPTVIEAEEGEA